ncbi:hypothetical protein H920_00109 [Fukomys damarensis]|uniref:Uncharacterized protein n=1 Tax=Fukomys damarensis TaxID=885580 RepID=A0A091E769_FUKDA|nr:hypothetical protein H920_00109 [Fukomys damarensis]
MEMRETEELKQKVVQATALLERERKEKKRIKENEEEEEGEERDAVWEPDPPNSLIEKPAGAGTVSGRS